MSAPSTPGAPLHESVSIVIPTLNEAENIEPLVEQIATWMPKCGEIIFVDDGSADGTREIIRSLTASIGVQLVQRDDPTLGLSGAVIAGAQAAGGAILVVMDADMSHPPEQIANLVRPLVDDRADMVIGSRYVKGGTTPDWPLYRKAMSRVAAASAYPLTGVHDSMCGFFAIRRALLLRLAPRATGFKIAFEAIVRGGRRLRVLEIPIEFRDRRRGKSKMSLGVAVRFGFRWFAAVSRILFRR
jgi:dolichol-phosphate mannosyltransferase